MKKKIKKWVIRLTAFFLLVTTLLLIIILNPILTYANKTTHNNFTIYSKYPVKESLKSCLDNATTLIQKSELYNPYLKLDVCLNDGSIYPAVIEKIQDKAFARGFYNKVVLYGKLNEEENTIELNGYKWNLTELLVHEITHCLQYEKFGFWQSNPIGNKPIWKWEGYAEYIARRNYSDLKQNLERLNDDKNWAIELPDKTICPTDYYNHWLLVQYYIDIKRMTFLEIINSKISEAEAKAEMMKWYVAHH